MALSAVWERALYRAWDQDTVNISIAVPAVQDYNLVLRLPWQGTIYSLTGKTSAGTVTGSLKVNAAAIANLTGLVFTTSSVQTVATPGSTTIFNAGDALVLSVSAVAAPGTLDLTVNWQRTGK